MWWSTVSQAAVKEPLPSSFLNTAVKLQPQNGKRPILNRMKTHSRCLDLFPNALEVTNGACSAEESLYEGPSPEPGLLFSRTTLSLFIPPSPLQFIRDKSEEFMSQQINMRGCGYRLWLPVSTPESGRQRKHCVGTPGCLISYQINPCLCYGSPVHK